MKGEQFRADGGQEKAEPGGRVRMQSLSTEQGEAKKGEDERLGLQDTLSAEAGAPERS